MYLYHGSGYKQDELMPGFKRSGKLVQWDVTESNEWLYAAVHKEEAIAMGFASTLEKLFQIKRYKTQGREILVEIESGRIPTQADLNAVQVYLYTIQKDDKSQWVLVNNAYNDLKEEYKTKATLTDCLVKVEAIDMAKWLAGKKITVRGPGGRAYDW